ncbi:MAG: PilZ domain-containing protein [Acidobacteria bacterium]|nr:PilZ domain-containing protein [Acidobacteriota bacterium]
MLRSILLSRDESTVRIITRAFKDLEVEAHHCPDASRALSEVSANRYDAIVVDDEIEDAHIMLEKVLELPSCSKSVRIALAQPTAKMHAIFKTGTQIILYKPLSAERVRHGLRAVRNLMARERRRGASRVHTMLPARMSSRNAKGGVRQVFIADLSDSGAALSYENGPVPPGNVSLEFSLPGNPERVHCTAELVWQANEGSAGVRFVDMPTYARKQLSEWLKENAGSTSAEVMAKHAGNPA